VCEVVYCLQNSLKDGLNYGLYLPESNGRSGKFLDDARPLRDYPLSGPVALLEVRVVVVRNPLTPLSFNATALLEV